MNLFKRWFGPRRTPKNAKPTVTLVIRQPGQYPETVVVNAGALTVTDRTNMPVMSRGRVDFMKIKPSFVDVSVVIR